MKKDLLVVSFPCHLWCWLVSGKDGQQFCNTTLADEVQEVQDTTSQNSTEIIENMESKTTGVMEEAEQQTSTNEPIHAAATTNQQVSREQAIENIRRR
jgi:L-lactate utilization protein LutC